jgi:cell division septation protein DedD
VQPTHLCIISRDPLRGGHFVASLQASLRPEDYLEIIVDRRYGGSSGASDLREDRRRQPQVDLVLEADGFAIVPASVSRARAEEPIEPLFPVDDDDENLESILDFQRQRSGRLIPILGVLGGVMLAALVWFLAEQVTGQSLLSQLFTGRLPAGPNQPPGQTNESSAMARSSAVTEEPVIAETRPARPETARGETSTSTRGASAPANEPGAPPRAGTGQGASGARPKLGATARQSSNAPPLSNQVTGTLPAGAATPKPTPEQVVAHRAELVRAPVSRGWGESYTVRLLDPAGRPMVVTNALLVVRMANGTVEKIAMGALPEPGTYRGTVPLGRSTPVDLRVRMTTGDESLEVPLRPTREKN